MAYYPRKKRLEKLQYVDQHVLHLATEGNLERLKEMLALGYSNLNVCDKRGKPAAYLAKKAGHMEVAKWLEEVGGMTVSINYLI